MKQKRLITTLIIKSLVVTLALFGCGESSSDSDEENNEAVTSGSGTTSTSQTFNPFTAPRSSQVELNIRGDQAATALTAAPIEVIGKDGAVEGMITLTRADVVIKEIKFEFMELEDEEEKSEEKEEESDEETSLSLMEDESEESGGEEEGSEEDSDEDSEEYDADSEEDDEELKFKGTYRVDLLTNTVTPELGSRNFPETMVKEMELELHKAEDGDAATLGIDGTDPLNNRSVWIEGTYTPTGGEAVAFSLGYELSESFEIENKKGIKIDAAAINNLIISFKVSDWLKFNNPKTNEDGVSMADLAAGDIVLDKDAEGKAKLVRKVIKENIKMSAESGEDSDGDGELGDDEDGDDTDDEEEKEEE